MEDLRCGTKKADGLHIGVNVEAISVKAVQVTLGRASFPYRTVWQKLRFFASTPKQGKEVAWGEGSSTRPTRRGYTAFARRFC